MRTLLLRNSRKTGADACLESSTTACKPACALDAPPKGLASSSAVWRRASAPFALLAICLSALPGMAAQVYTFSISGPENVTGPIGLPEVSGWGYTIHNESSSDWLVTTNLMAGAFLYATPKLLFDFPDIAPGATVDLPYDPVTPSGLYQILWSSDTPPGFVNSGTFALNAQWWNGNPLSGGSFLSNAPDTSQPYSASFTTTPEPATVGLEGLALLVISVLVSIRRLSLNAASLLPLAGLASSLSGSALPQHVEPLQTGARQLIYRSASGRT